MTDPSCSSGNALGNGAICGVVGTNGHLYVNRFMAVDLLIWADKSLGSPVVPISTTLFKPSAAYAARTAPFMSTSARLL